MLIFCLANRGFFNSIWGLFQERREEEKKSREWVGGFGFTISFGTESFELSCHLGFKPQE